MARAFRTLAHRQPARGEWLLARLSAGRECRREGDGSPEEFYLNPKHHKTTFSLDAFVLLYR